MHLPLKTALTLLAFAACVPGGPLYIGRADTVTFEGDVYVFEEKALVPHAEACLFGTDTVCVRADAKGHYWMSTYASITMDDSTVVLRFRIEGAQPAYSTQTGMTGKETRVVNCAISNRVTLSSQPRDCLPIP